MQDKVVVMTGATSGIGLVAGQRLAAMGARIVLVGRDRARTDAALAALAAAGPAKHSARLGDLSLISETRRVGAEIAAAEPRIDVLINNAGALFNRREVTREGLERTFATNHMSYFVLTMSLLDRLRASGPARIVSTASVAHDGATLAFDDLQTSSGYSGLGAYGRSKLCNVLFTRELARRLAGTGVTANCLHPGFVATRFGERSGGPLQFVLPLAKLAAITPEKGADTIIWLAAAPEAGALTGAYVVRRRVTTPSIAARDDAGAARLWTESERLNGAIPA